MTDTYNENKYEKFWAWLEAGPDDVVPSEFQRVFGQELADSGDVNHAIDPETVERFRVQLSHLHFDVITGKLAVGSEEYITRREGIFEPLDASVTIAADIEEWLS